MDGSSCTGPLLRAVLNNQISIEAIQKPLVLDLILIFVLILINGFFAAAEMAVVTQNDNKIRQLRRRRRTCHGSCDLSTTKRFLSTIQVAITLAVLIQCVCSG